MVIQKRIALGELLLQSHLITQEQLANVLAKQKKDGGRLGTLLVELGYIKERILNEFLAKQLGLPFVDLETHEFNPELIHKLPEAHARRFRAILLKETPTGYLVGMADPQDIFGADEIARVLKKPVQLAVVGERELMEQILSLYHHEAEIGRFAKEISEELNQADTQTDYDLSTLAAASGTEDAPVVKLLQSIFQEAVQARASDIHIEPDEQILHLRFRVDGILQERTLPEVRIAVALAVRLKLMAGLNIAEKRLPQDGRFCIRTQDRVLDVRVSMMPTQYGESIVMRLLDRSVEAIKLDKLGLPPHIMERLQRLIELPHGMLLITGPTGSGKTTTLYSLLNVLNTSANKIITVEDPVEYRLPRITQVQVNMQVELTFARILRSALRQDPDIIMVGEIRDSDTASIALRAAITGHLVLATLHTNDAISSVVRLLDMGSESFLVGSALRAVIGQRLVRQICPHCVAPMEPTVIEKKWMEEMNMPMDQTASGFKQGKGCLHCRKTGYYGRLGVYELLEMDEKLLQALRASDPATYHKLAKDKGFKSLSRAAFDLAAQGKTTLDEVIRVAVDVDAG